MFHPEITLKWLSSMMSMGSLLVCNLLLPRNSFKDHMISLDPTGTVQIMSWVRRWNQESLSSNLILSIIQQSNFDLGEDVYLTTAYFVDPSSICQGGRDQAAFDVEGTGNRLWFQNGPTIKDMHVAPLTVAEADINVS